MTSKHPLRFKHHMTTWASTSTFIFCLFSACIAQAQNNSLALDGSGDYVDVSWSQEMTDLTNDFTIEFWANPSSTHQIDPERTNGTHGTGGQRYAIGPVSGTSVWASGHAGVGVSVGTNGVSVYEHASNYLPALLVWQGTLSGWTHIAVVYTDRTPSLFIDGVLVKSGFRSPQNFVHARAQSLGGMVYGYFHGQLDEIRYWNYSKTAADIGSTKNHELNGRELGLVANWSFNENLGTTAFDKSPGENDGQLQGDAVFTNPGAPLSAGFSSTNPFYPVQETGLPYQVVIRHAEIDSNSFPPNAQIGLFDDTLCVGAAFIDPNGNTQVVCWQGDPGRSLPGFTNGKPIIAKVRTDWFNNMMSFPANLSFVQGDGNFGTGTFSVADISVTSGFEPEIAISHNNYNFNAVIAGNTVSFPLVVSNTGNAILNVDQISTTSAVFQSSETDLLITPGESDTIDVSFTPTQVTSYIGALSISSNSPGNENLNISLAGTGLPQPQPEIYVNPSFLDFPGIAVGTQSTLSVDIVNRGNGTLEVTQISSSNPIFSVLGSTTHSLEQNENASVEIQFSPLNSGSHSGQLLIESNDGNVQVSLTGLASAGHFQAVEPTGIPYHIIAQSIDVDGSGLKIGDEVGVFDDTLCVGAGVVGPGGKALFLDGSSGQRAHTGSWSTGATWTIEAWANPSQIFSGRRSIFGGMNDCRDWGINFTDGEISMTIRQPGGCTQTVGSGIFPSPGEWYHIASTNDGTTASLFVDGQLKAQTTVDPNYSGSSRGTIIGGESCCSANNFSGLIDEVRCWNSARSQADLIDNMRMHLQGNEPGLVGYWNFDDGSPNDLSPSNRHASLQSGATIRDGGAIPDHVQIVCWQEDPSQGLAGFGVGNVIAYKLFADLFNTPTELDATALYQVGDGTFGFGQFAVVDLSASIVASPGLVISDTTLYVGQVETGQSVSGTITFYNIGNAPMQLSMHENSVPFSTNYNSGQLAAGDSVQVTISFAPSTAGNHTANLSVISDDPNTQQTTIRLEGFALPSGQSDISLSAQALNFADVVVGQQKTLGFHVINTGTAALQVSSISSSGANFTINPTSFNLNSTNDNREVYVTFSPDFKGGFSETLTINSNASTKTILVSGTGYDGHFSAVEETGSPYTVVVQNTNLGAHLSTGDEIGIFDNSLCVGTGVVQADLNGFSISIDGNGDYLQVQEANDFDLSDFTYSVWVKPDNPTQSNWHTILDIDNDEQLLGTNGDRFAIFGRCGAHYHGTVSTGWQHIALTVSNGSYQLYKDGSLIGSGSGCSPQINADYLMIGSGSGGNEYFDGNIDEVSLWNRALTQSEIINVSNRSLEPNETGLVAYYNFANQSLNDQSGNANHAQLLGNTAFSGQQPIINSGNIVITAWEQVPNLNLAGFTAGNTIDYKIWTNINGFPSEFDATGLYEVGDGTFGYGQFSVIDLNAFTPSIQIQPTQLVEALVSGDSSEQEVRIINDRDEELYFQLCFPPVPGRFNVDYHYSPGSGSSPAFGPLIFSDTDTVIQKSFGSGGPGNGVGNDDFQIRWTGRIYAENTGIYNFRSLSDDGVRLFIGGTQIIDDWVDHGNSNRYGSIVLDQGFHDFEYHYYENSSGANVSLYWTPPGLSERLITANESKGTWLTPSAYSDTVLAGDTSILTFSFDASALTDGLYTVEIDVKHNSPNQPQGQIQTTLNVTGDPHIVSSDDSLSFQPTVVGSTDTVEVILSNIGTDTLNIDTIVLVGSQAIALGNTSGSVLLPLETQSLSITFQPSTNDTVSAIITVLSDAVNNDSLQIVVAGHGLTPPSAAITPLFWDDTIASGAVKLDTFFVINQGQATLTYLIDEQVSWLSTQPSSGNIGVGDSVAIVMNISTIGLVAGDYSDALDVLSNDPAQPTIAFGLDLHVTGEPQIKVDDVINFGVVFVDSTETVNFIIQNTGADTLQLDSIELNSGVFSFSGNQTALIAPAASHQVNLHFSPPSSTSFSAVMTLHSNSAIDPVKQVALLGEGLVPQDIALSVDTLFESLNSGSTNTKTITISNSGRATLAFNASIDAPAGGLLDLDGNGDYGNVINTSNLNPDTALTIEAWVFLRDNRDEYIVAKEFSFQGPWRLFINSASRLEFRLNTVNSVVSNVVVQNGQWTHLAATFDGTEMRLYINGVLAAQQQFSTFNIFSSTDNLRIGRSFSNQYLNGKMDELRVWGVARSQQEILSMMNFSLSGNETGLNLYFPFNDNQGNIIRDQSPYSVDGTLHGNASRTSSDLLINDYLSINPAAGSIQQQSSLPFSASFDVNGMISGQYRQNITFLSNDPDEPIVQLPVVLTVIGQPSIAISNDTLYFDTTFVGFESSLNLTVTNTGSELLNIQSWAASDTNFEVVSTFSEVSPFTSRQTPIKFAPNAAGTLQGTVTISSDAINAPAIFLVVKGVAVDPPVIDVNPSALDFGPVIVGFDSTISVRLKNTGAFRLEIAQVNLSNSTSFFQSLAAPQTLAAGDSVDFTIRFEPQQYVSFTEQLTLTTNIGDHIIPLSGSGVLAGDDIELAAIVNPQTACGMSNAETVTVRIRNNGSIAQSGFDVAYVFNGGTAVSENVGALVVQPGSTADFQFSTSIDLSAFDNYSLAAFTQLAGDQNLANDSLAAIAITNYPPLNILVTDDLESCSGSTVNLSVSGGTGWQWSNGSTNPLISVNPTSTTTYTVTATDDNGCTDVGATLITVLSLPSPPSVQVNGSATLCQGYSVELVSSYLINNSWQNGESTQTIHAQVSGEYRVTYTDTNYCQSTSGPVTINVLPEVSISASGLTTICSGESITLTADNTVSQLWSTGDTGTSITVSPTDSTTYSVTGVNQLGCSSTDSIDINILPAVPPGQVSGMIPTNGASDLSNPISFSWLPATNASHYDIFIWLASESRPGNPQVGSITQISHLYNRQLLYEQTYNWQIRARNSCFETFGPTQSFTLRDLPDLIVSQVNTPVSAFSSQTIAVNWEVSNPGPGITGSTQWVDAVYLSSDQTFETQTDLYLGGVSNLSSLNSGESYSQTANFTLPQGISGNYYIFVLTDRYNSVIESDNNNNLLRSDPAMLVQLTPPADLKVSSIIAPNNTFSGQDINVTWTVLNDGNGSTDFFRWTDRIFLSEHADGNLTDAVILGTFNHQGHLDPAESYSDSRTVTLPQQLFGTYYVHVATDISNAVFEHALENNNLSTSDSMVIFLTPPPDLQVTGLSAVTNASVQQPISVQWRVENLGGTAPTVNNWTDRVFISSSPVFSENAAQQLGAFGYSGTLHPGDGYNSSRTVTVPDDLFGEHYIHVQTDAYNDVFEHTNEHNNVGTAADSIHLSAPDLEVTQITTPATASSGTLFSFNWQTTNNGPGQVFNSNWLDRIYLSKLDTFNPDSLIILTTNAQSSGFLPVGASLNQQKTITLPNGISGNYYLYVQTDRSNTVYEHSGEGNNFARSASFVSIALSPTPNLVFSGNVTPDTAQSGTAMNFSFTVSNNGNATAQGQPWRDRVYFSKLSSWNQDSAQFAAGFLETQSLAAGNSYTTNNAMTWPASITTSGYYYLHFQTDASDDLYEQNGENDNRAVSNRIWVEAYPPVDLTVSAFQGPDSVDPGQSVPISYTVNNIASVNVVASNWTDGLYLSNDTLFDSNDQLIRTWSGLSFGGTNTYTNNSSFVVPNGVSGDFYLFVVTDIHASHNDSDRSNNSKRAISTRGTVNITHVPPPDLNVTNFSAPSQGTAGQPITVSWTIRNVGTGSTQVNNWSDRLYLSTDFTIDPHDYNLGTFTQTSNLDTNDSYIETRQIFLPIQFDGNFILLFKTDHSDVIYEGGNEQNNFASSLITVAQAPPSDLVVSNITHPDTGIAGDFVTISWQLRNLGQNPANGHMQDIVYLSTDLTWDINDILLGEQSGNINLAPQSTLNRSLTARLNGASIRNYNIIIRTDILNNIAESDETNNDLTAGSQLYVTMQELPLYVLTNDNLLDDTELYYQLIIPDTLIDETVLISLKGDSINGANELYVRYGDVPTRVEYDFAFSSPFAGNQEIVIPSTLDGVYYIMVYGNVLGGTNQQISLLAEIIDFEIRSINSNVGGNFGQMTLQIDGAKFDEDLTITLESGGQTSATAFNLQLVDPTRLFTTFDLTGLPIGFYDVVLSKPDGSTARLDNGFQVVAASAGSTGGPFGPGGFSCNIGNIGADGLLELNVQQPASTRPNRIVSFTIQFTNDGNVDIPCPERFFVSTAGAPISFTVEGLEDDQQDLLLVFGEINGPPGILRPGATGSVIIYTKAVAPLSFGLLE